MNITIHDSIVNVTLSRRNLLDLLVALTLDEPGKTPRLVRTTPTGLTLYVTAEADQEHYNGRTAGPGITYPTAKPFPKV
jgi:hypothetical protein